MEAARQYCLKWNNHPRNVASVFDKLRTEELFVDVTLATADRQVIRAHRVLLSAGSAYLERVLAVTPSEHPTIVLSNIRYKELKLLVDFMYSGEIAVGQAQFPGLMQAANWLQVRGLCTEEVKDEEEEKEEEEAELTVTPRKRHHSEESEEEQIVGPEEDEVLVEASPSKQFKPMYDAIHGVANAVWMSHHEEEREEGMSTEEEGRAEGGDTVPDMVSVSGPAVTAAPHPAISPGTLNEQLLQAMQLCSNPYLNPMAAMQHSRTALDLTSPNSSFSSYPSSPFKSSSPTSPSKASLLVSAAPVRRYKQYTEDSLQAALREIMGGQSINRSSMKHSIPARTLRDWMKRLNIKSVFTHHKTDRGAGEEESLASTSPEPLLSPTFGLSPANLSMIRAGFTAHEEGGGGEEGGLRIDEGPKMVEAPKLAIQQIAMAAN